MNGADSWSALEMSYDNYTGVTTVFIACPKIGGRVAFEMVNHRYFLASPGTMDIKQDPFRKLQDPALDEILENLRSATESEFNWRTFGVAEMKAAVDLVGEACSAVVQVIVKRKYPTFKDMCDGFFATISSSA
ncbi:hypothetical protein FOZ61_002724 [Perkinsus olseni]|uniref:Uncharacterized protein n=1 Tax=Perkinsus olseni TaxID=32597 RepID=A0A7J6LS85_PEROL|nr:hypothetical protein FOL46_006899 [Perkinsus olseni]KAF4662093.1 hypothetical protein FOZ61_002724 [Perkinsus olseni]